jgi:hypothetical protein
MTNDTLIQTTRPRRIDSVIVRRFSETREFWSLEAYLDALGFDRSALKRAS